MLNQFSRTELLIDKEAIEKLQSSRVAVFGIGGVGGYTVEALARSGVGAIDIVDDDKVCLTNINRQIIATHQTVGKYKVDVAEKRIKQINPDCIVNKHQIFYAPETLLAYPALAIGQCHRAMSGMAKKLRKNVNRAMNLLNEYQQSKFDKVQKKEDLIDKYESRLGDYLIKLTKHEMNTAQTRQVSLYLHTINDFERIGDHASYIA